MRNHIVILGGMGPQASVRLHTLLIEKAPLFTSGAPDEFPAILHASMQIPDFIASKTNEVQTISIITETMRQLDIEQARSVAIACNTAHLLCKQLELDRDNFVSMIRAVCDEVSKSGIKRLGLLASPNTIQSGLYARPLKAIGIELIVPDKKDIQALELVIRSVIAGKKTHELRDTLDTLAMRLMQRGAEAVLLGCTELPIVGLSPHIRSFDSLNALADKLLERHFVIQG